MSTKISIYLEDLLNYKLLYHYKEIGEILDGLMREVWGAITTESQDEYLAQLKKDLDGIIIRNKEMEEEQ